MRILNPKCTDGMQIAVTLNPAGGSSPGGAIITSESWSSEIVLPSSK